MIIFRDIPADVTTTSIDVYPPILLVVGTGCKRDPSASVYKHDAFKAFSSWLTFSNVLSPRDTQYLFAMSKLDCVSFKYFALSFRCWRSCQWHRLRSKSSRWWREHHWSQSACRYWGGLPNCIVSSTRVFFEYFLRLCFYYTSFT